MHSEEEKCLHTVATLLLVVSVACFITVVPDSTASMIVCVFLSMIQPAVSLMSTKEQKSTVPSLQPVDVSVQRRQVGEKRSITKVGPGTFERQGVILSRESKSRRQADNTSC